LQLRNRYGEPSMEAVTGELKAELNRLQILYDDPVREKN
jgi:hypothetical protein